MATFSSESLASSKRALSRRQEAQLPSLHKSVCRAPVGTDNGPHVADSLFRFILEMSGRHQVGLAAITVLLCLVVTLPLELQRRIVNDVFNRQDFRTIGT